MLKRALYLTRMLRAEWRDPESLRKAQNHALRKLVQHAALRVPYYREIYAHHGIDAERFRGLEDLQRLPIVDKRKLRAAAPRVLAEDRAPQSKQISTSGSTGEPFQFEIGREHDQWRKAQYLRPYLTNGRGLLRTSLRLTAFPSTRTRWFSSIGLLREVQLDCATDPRVVLQRWRELQPSILQGYPSSLQALAQHCLESGERLSPAPHRVFTDSEMLRPEVRSLIARAFGLEPIDIFGTYETENIAYQCSEHGGYHVTTDSVVLEVVRDGKVVPHGEEGHLVASVLTNHTHPFIRYRLGDLGRFATESCPCGRSFPLLEVISGRADDMLELTDGTRRTPMKVLARLDAFVPLVYQYQLHQLAVDQFELWIVPSTDYTPEVGVQMLQAIAEPLGHASVALKVVETAPRDPSGKLRSFIRDMKPSSRG